VSILCLSQTGHSCAHCQRQPTHYSESYDDCAPLPLSTWPSHLWCPSQLMVYLMALTSHHILTKPIQEWIKGLPLVEVPTHSNYSRPLISSHNPHPLKVLIVCETILTARMFAWPLLFHTRFFDGLHPTHVVYFGPRSAYSFKTGKNMIISWIGFPIHTAIGRVTDIPQGRYWSPPSPCLHLEFSPEFHTSMDICPLQVSSNASFKL
jgi:hypothetical protein